ncbi:MAG: hypothetical protein GY786_12925 [Proteobacteria bacterium]|nr:hypothetical protein [Pseudomonadota bacterium]
MDLEFPTLKIALTRHKIDTLLAQIIKNTDASVKDRNQKKVVSHDYQYELSDRDIQIKLNRLASQRLRSREYLYFFLGIFFLAIVTELFILKGFFGSEGDKMVPYFKAETMPPDATGRKKTVITKPLIKASRGLQPWAAVLLIGASGSSFYILYRSRQVHDKKIESLKNDISREYKRKNMDVAFENQNEEVEIDIIGSEEHTEVVFGSEKGSPLLAHLVMSLLELSKNELDGARTETEALANNPMKLLLYQFGSQKIVGWKVDQQVLNEIKYYEEVGDLEYHRETNTWS